MVLLAFGRPVVPNFMPADEPFVIGKAVLTEGSDVTIVATGHLVWEALVAAEALEQQGISAEVINIHTKPLDEEAIIIGKNKMHRYS
jgi:transketolase